jgi:hypothetical protein
MTTSRIVTSNLCSTTGTQHADHLGILRIDFGAGDGRLRRVHWQEWFKTFDGRRLNFIYQEQRGGAFVLHLGIRATVGSEFRASSGHGERRGCNDESRDVLHGQYHQRVGCPKRRALLKARLDDRPLGLAMA